MVDLNLLRVFAVLYEEGSVSRAAVKLGLSQPTVSTKLMQLRALFNDPLFLNNGRGLTPTTRAVDIFAHVRFAVDRCEECLSPFAPTPAPASVRRQVVVGMSDDFEVAFARTLLERLLQERPDIRLSIVQTNCQLAQTHLLERQCDITLTTGGFSSTAISQVFAGTTSEAVLLHRDSLSEPEFGSFWSRKSPSGQY